MDPWRTRSKPRTGWLPRTRGDGPVVHRIAATALEASPHTRGWTPAQGGSRPCRRGFPAHAGMDPMPSPHRRTGLWLPRTRGDGPGPQHRRRIAGAGFPAHAGMDPVPETLYFFVNGLPRTRGDGPQRPDAYDLFRKASPHTRGWTPGLYGDTVGRGASPHTRGWTLRADRLQPHHGGFPAHAGMDPMTGFWFALRRWLPRTRGDGPVATIGRTTEPRASPHTRGWTPARSGRPIPCEGSPAHAGMDPREGDDHRWCGRLPRTRGDGPQPPGLLFRTGEAPPHTRGWTPSTV